MVDDGLTIHCNGRDFPWKAEVEGGHIGVRKKEEKICVNFDIFVRENVPIFPRESNSREKRERERNGEKYVYIKAKRVPLPTIPPFFTHFTLSFYFRFIFDVLLSLFHSSVFFFEMYKLGSFEFFYAIYRTYFLPFVADLFLSFESLPMRL